MERRKIVPPKTPVLFFVLFMLCGCRKETAPPDLPPPPDFPADIGGMSLVMSYEELVGHISGNYPSLDTKCRTHGTKLNRDGRIDCIFVMKRCAVNADDEGVVQRIRTNEAKCMSELVKGKKDYLMIQGEFMLSKTADRPFGPLMRIRRSTGGSIESAQQMKEVATKRYSAYRSSPRGFPWTHGRELQWVLAKQPYKYLLRIADNGFVEETLEQLQ